MIISAGLTRNIDTYGARAGDSAASSQNTAALNRALSAAAPGDTVLVTASSTYWVTGGVVADSLQNVTVQIDGDLTFDTNLTAWPHDAKAQAINFFEVHGSRSVRLTGSGTIDGQGVPWWDAAINGEIGSHNTRPHMLHIVQSADIVLEGLTLRNSPRFHVAFSDCSRVVIRHLTIDVDRFTQRALKAVAHARRIARVGGGFSLIASTLARHLGRLDRRPFDASESLRDWLLDQAVKLLPAWALQPEDLNTDGIDPNGIDFHIHDVTINNDDDSIAVKPSSSGTFSACTRNMLIENMTLTGFGASIGSVPPHADVNCVRNITFRNISMPGTGKGIYIKCPTQGCATFANIMLRNIVINEPLLTPGVILGNISNPMSNLTFSGVRVKHGLNPLRGRFPFGSDYKCAYADINIDGGTNPKPLCVEPF